MDGEAAAKGTISRTRASFLFALCVLDILVCVCVCVANKSKVLWGIPRDPDIVAALQELEDEENEMMAEDEKPKVGGRLDCMWLYIGV